MLFFQNEAGEGGRFGPVGKIAHQYGVFCQGQGAQPGEDALLLAGADDFAAVEDGGKHPAGAQGVEGCFQCGDAALGGGKDVVVGPGQPAEVEHYGVCRAGLHILQKICVAVAVELRRVPEGGEMRLGGGDGLGLDVKAQHPPAGGAAEPAQKGGIPAVAAGGVDAKGRGSQPLGQKLLHEAYGGQVRRAAAGQLPALGPEIELCPESLLARVRRGRSVAVRVYLSL